MAFPALLAVLLAASRDDVAIVSCLTSNGIHETLPLARHAVSELLISSLGRTVELAKFRYVLFFGVDHDDRVWTSRRAGSFLKKLGDAAGFDRTEVRVFETATNHIPMNEIARAAMLETNASYFVRVNDDTEFVTAGWTSLGVAALRGMKPPNVGVVGPTFSEGNTGILTHDMVHRTHLEIFNGEYYPDAFENWWLDDWISRVYGPARTLKLPGWTVKHHVAKHGTRYAVSHHTQAHLETELKKGANVIKAWIKLHSHRDHNAVAFSLYGSSPRYTENAVINAELMSTIYAGWRMRVYHDSTVPPGVLQKLSNFTWVDLVDMTGTPLENKMTWKFLAASEPGLKHVCFRDIDSRVSTRERAAVTEWIRSKKLFHVMRDHPSHSHYAMSGGMWCAMNGAFPQMRMLLLRQRLGTQYIADMDFLNSQVWPTARQSVLQHDAFGCHDSKWGDSRPFPTKRKQMNTSKCLH